MKDFLLELQTEELPPKLLPKIIQSLADNFVAEFKLHNLEFKNIQQFATSRRLAILTQGLSEVQPEQHINKKGPATSANQQAILGFAKANSVQVTNLTIAQTTKGDYYYFKQTQAGEQTSNLLATISKRAIANIAIKQPMRWGINKFSFIRPVHSLIMLFDKTIIPTTIMNLKSGRTTIGMRFNDNNIITIASANSYQKTMLKQGKIEVNFNQRKNNIKQQIETIATHHNATIIENDALLNEVCALVEYPNALIGQFDKNFLKLPKEVVVSSMAEHQKYFSIVDNNNNLMNCFIAVSNIDSPTMSVIVKGNEKVIKPRLEDAKFFWQQDQITTLEAKLTNLKTVLFMQNLGTMFEKSERIEIISGQLAKHVNADEVLAKRAGRLSKADLSSGMVNEFTNLQGIMGGYYARIDNEDKKVVEAISCHYHPKFAGDTLPTNAEGLSVAIADKLDTICGIFGINQQPTGSKDPYALRRLALSLMRIIIEKKLNINLKALITFVLSLHFKTINSKITDDILAFMLERLRNYYQDKNINITSLLAASTNNTQHPYDLHLRVLAIDEFSKSVDSNTIIEINKRINNILKEAQFNIIANPQFSSKIENNLHQAIQLIEKDNTNNYQLLLQRLLSLKPILDNFFESVMINDKNSDIKNTRLSLIHRVQQLFTKIGDLTIIN